GLVGRAVLQLERAIGGQDQQRGVAVVGLDDGGQVVGGRRSRGAQQQRGLAADLGLPEGEEGGAALVHDVVAAQGRLAQGGEGEGRGSGAGADDRLAHPALRQHPQKQPRPLGGQRGIAQADTPRAANMLWSLSSVSACSLAGSESLTMPAPAYRCARAPCKRAERRAATNSPSPLRSNQPTGPAYQPRSAGSRVRIHSSAPPLGVPPTAGVGCRRATKSRTCSGSLSSARIGVHRCNRWRRRRTSGAEGQWMLLATGFSAARSSRTTMACSLASLALSSRALAPPSPAGRDPASASVSITAPVLRTSRSGVAPKKQTSPCCSTKRVEPPDCARSRSSNDGRLGGSARSSVIRWAATTFSKRPS